MTVAYGTPQERATSYAYDELGRLQSVTYPTGQVNWTCYDAAGRVVRTVSNVRSNPNPGPCDPNFDPLPPNDLVHETVYDKAGNAIASIEWLDGQEITRTTRTYYDRANRPVFVVRNLDPEWGIDEENPPLDDIGLDYNLVSEIRYDGNGSLIASISWGLVDGEVVTHATRTYYDEQNRPFLVIQNLVGLDIGDPIRRPMIPSVSSGRFATSKARWIRTCAPGRPTTWPGTWSRRPTTPAA
jgi:YD repeat-containing protein